MDQGVDQIALSCNQTNCMCPKVHLKQISEMGLSCVVHNGDTPCITQTGNQSVHLSDLENKFEKLINCILIEVLRNK